MALPPALRLSMYMVYVCPKAVTRRVFSLNSRGVVLKMSSEARKPSSNAPKSAFFTRNLFFAIAILSLSAVASMAAFGPQSMSLQRLLTPFIGAAAKIIDRVK